MIEGSWILLLISFLLNNALLFVRGLPVYTSESSHGYQDLPRTLDLLSTYRDKLSSSHAPNGQHSEAQMHSSLPHPSEMHEWLSLSPPKQDVSRKSLDMLPPPMVRFDSTLYSNPIDWLPPHPTADLADYSRPPIGSHLKDSHTEAGHQMASSSTTSLQQVTMNHGTNHLTGKWWHTGLSRTEKKAYKKLLDASLAKTKDDRNGMLRKYYERLTLEQKQRAIEAYLTQNDEAMEQIADEFVESVEWRRMVRVVHFLTFD